MRGAALRPQWPTLTREVVGQVADLVAAGASVLLCGAAGVGKSYVAQQVAAAAPACVPVLCTPAGNRVPLGALHAWLAELGLADATGAPSVSPLVLAGQVAPQGPGDEPVLVHVDDIDLLDAASAELLALLCRRGVVQLLATLRSPGGGALPVPLARLLVEDQVVRVEVAPLTPNEVGELVQLALDGPVHHETVRFLHRTTEGNNLFLRELVRTGAAHAAFVLEHDVWRWHATPAPEALLLPALFSDELDALSAAEREAVELVALTEPIAIDALALAVGPDVVTGLVRSGLLVEVEQHVRTHHPLFAESARGRIGPWQRRQLFERLHETLPSPPTDAGGGLLRWLAWGAESGAKIAAGSWLAGARAAAAAGDLPYAEELVTHALATTPLAARDRLEAHTLRAEVRRFRAQRTEALADLDAAAATLDAAAGEDGDWLAGQVLAATRTRADLLQYVDDDPAAALTVLADGYARAARFAPGHPGLARQPLETLTRQGWSGQCAALRAEVPRLLAELAQGAASRPGTDVLEAVSPALLALAWEGRTATLRDLARAGLHALADVHSGPTAARPHLAVEIVCTTFFTDLYGGVPAGDEGLDHLVPTAIAQDIDAGLLAAGAGRRLLAEGAWAEADRVLADALALLEQRDPSGFGAWALAAAALAAAGVGDLTRSAALAADAARAPSRTSRSLVPDLRTLVARARLAGDPDQAVDEIERLRAWAHAEGHLLTELEALHLLAVAAPATVSAEDAVRATHLASASSMEAPVARLLADHVAAVQQDDAAVASAAIRRLAEHGRCLPARGQEAATLSRREREVASLVAGGLSTPEIAERLHLSTRTVESHIARIFTKLGINRRAQVRDLLG
ncbi:helix-turn-helix transcriptional regulator [Pimelobacter simplex]|uniref:Regulatory protein, LuxR n=3 Tax=Nocardioides simplex TaxID=2045 RepID=A0A0A1DL75_NOCSI|nr:LuxR family transcriptional regulator [Pimelobacter simplex]AIY16120.1 regulatory protein, LuxR [Pimelobacter simplex]GEB12209.1 transcriptional regulator [Pimelobacter simplex]SFM98208.1 regulatory protein, luxR family [Pimelobacter simplex]